MKKRMIVMLIAVLLTAVCAVAPVCAAVSDSPRVIDKADLLTDEEETVLTAKLNEYSRQQNCDIVFLTEPDMEHEDYTFYAGDVADFADMYYETHGYDNDGVLVMILLDDGHGGRKIQFSCSGKCMRRLSDDEQNDIIDDVYFTLKSEDYYSAYNTMAYEINDKLTPKLSWYMLPLAVGIGFALAMIIMLALRAKLKSVAMQKGAANYVRPGSMRVTASRDTFLYANVTKTRRESSSSGGSGRTSSGGGSHSGVGRSF